jgi:chromosome segregation ATPase
MLISSENNNKQHRQATEELQAYLASSDKSASSVSSLESKIRQLEAHVVELEEECDDQHTEITKLKQEKVGWLSWECRCCR